MINFSCWLAVSLLALPAYADSNLTTSTQKISQSNQTHISTKSSYNRLLSITLVGGLCIDGLCRDKIVINRDGSYSYKDSEHRKKAGVLEQKDITVLNFLTDRTDFNRIKSKKFEGTCPTAYDGAEKTYTFYTQGGVETFSDCQVQIDPHQPLFKRLEIIINKITLSPNN